MYYVYRSEFWSNIFLQSTQCKMSKKTLTKHIRVRAYLTRLMFAASYLLEWTLCRQSSSFNHRVYIDALRVWHYYDGLNAICGYVFQMAFLLNYKKCPLHFTPGHRYYRAVYYSSPKPCSATPKGDIGAS